MYDPASLFNAIEVRSRGGPGRQRGGKGGAEGLLQTRRYRIAVTDPPLQNRRYRLAATDSSSLLTRRTPQVDQSVLISPITMIPAALSYGQAPPRPRQRLKRFPPKRLQQQGAPGA